MIVGIFGVGAIGGSIGLRARRNGHYVLGFDSDAAAPQTATQLGAIDEAVPRDDLAARAEVLVLAAHLGATLEEIGRLKAQRGTGAALLTDVSSIKAPVVRAAAGLKNFVGSHPMAGTEHSGVRAARADLFDGCVWAYIPTGDEPLDERARDFIRSLGGSPLAITAEEHDRVVAITSHLPQVLAYCYARLLRDSPGVERLCGPVARELLRISTMGGAMWDDILAANAGNIERELRDLAADLEQVANTANISVAAIQNAPRPASTD
ncbi:MAG TPA: prephenate dehydrogenase/arogenate dehydrogenase family protein [Candidatus Cybelea sp.]